MSLITVNPETCLQDGLCAAVCPAQIIRFRKGEYPALFAAAETACIECGHCVAICPTASLSHQKMKADECPPVQKEFHLSEEQCEHFLRSRRSIRNYKSKAVPENQIQQLIEIARHAPSGRNAQDAEWLVISGQNKLHNLAEGVADWMRHTITDDPDLAAAMHLDYTLARWESGVDIIFRDAPIVIVAHAEQENPRGQSSCTIALTYLELAATSMDLGCCWAGYFQRAATTFLPLMEILSLPKGHQSFGAMMVGYPRFKYHRLPLRKPPKITWQI